MFDHILNDLIKALDENEIILLYVYRDFFSPFDYVNCAVSLKSGYSKEELLNKITPSDLVHPSVREEIYANFKRRIKGEPVPPSYEIPCVDKFGNTKWIHMAFSKIDYQGDPAILAIGAEITEKRKVENLLKVIVDILPHGLVVVDDNYNVIFCNKQAKRWMKNKSISDPIGEKCFRVFHLKDEPCKDCVAFRCLKSGMAVFEEVKRTSRSGDRWFEIGAYPIKGFEETVKEVVVYAKDITESKRLKEEELKSQRFESMALLAGGIAHDFNNILTSIMGNISLAMSISNSQEVKKYLKEAEKSCLYAKKLTYSLLTFSREEKPKMSAEDVISLLKEAISLVSFPERIKIYQEYEQDLPCVLIDRDQMVRVFQNIFVNAIEAITGQGEIRVSAVRDGDFVKISITDTGKGIPKEILPRIFDVFFSTKSKGTGLGLSVAYSIVKKHGGDIEVFSEEGKGSTFVVYLPVAESHEGKLKDLKDMQKKNVVVMDDNKGIRDMLKLYLEKQGFSVYTASKGEELLDMLENLKRKGLDIHLFILDIVVPDGMGGFEVIKKIRNEFPNSGFIAISGYYHLSQGIEDLGFDEFVRKPFTFDNLKCAILKVLNAKGGCS